MKKLTKLTLSLTLVLILLIVSVSVASAALLASGSFSILAHTLGGAQAPGGSASSASFQMVGAWGGPIGVSTGTNYAVCIGYVCSAGPSGGLLYLPIILK